jgi:hypothetical protein
MKGMVACLLVAMILSVTAPAFASSVPSRTTQDLAEVVSFAADDGTALATDFVIELLEDTESARKALTLLTDFVTGQGLAPARFFPEKVQEALRLLLPEGANLDEFVIEEFSPFDVQNYVELYGDVTATFQFATPYKDGQALVALIGLVTGTDEQGNPVIEWIPAKAEAEGGFVKVHYPKALLIRLNTQEAIIAILSEKLPQ